MFRKKRSGQEPRQRSAQSGPAVFSYYARGAAPKADSDGNRYQLTNPNQVQRSTYTFNWRHIPSYVAGLAMISGLMYATTLQTKPSIVLASVPGTVYRDPKVYQDSATSLWKQSLANRFKFLISTKKLERALQEQYGELADVQIELPLLGRRPVVRLTPDAPTLELISSNGAFYINANGKVLARTTEVTKNQVPALGLVHDEAGSSVSANNVVLPSTETAFLAQLFRQLQAEIVPVQSVTLPRNVANEADVRLVGQNYFIKFSITTDVRQAVGTYLAARSKLDKDGVTPSEYLDVRVEEKVFYK